MRISWKALGAIGAIVLAQGLCGGGIAHAQCTGNVFSSGDFESGMGTAPKDWIQVPTTPTVLDTTGQGNNSSTSCALFEQTTSAPVLTPPVASGALELRYKDSLTPPANIISETLTCNTTAIPAGTPMNLYLWIKQEQTGDPADKITVTLNDGSGPTQSSVDTAGGDLTTPLSINVDSFAGKTVSVVIQADTKTATDKPTLYLFRAAEFAATPPATPTASAVLFSSANYVEDPSVAVIPGYTVPVEYVDTAGSYSVFRFGGIGYPSISCKLSMLSGSGSAADQLLVVSGDPLVQMGMLAAADTASSNKCEPVTASLSAMPSGKLAFRSTITGSTTFVMDDVSMTYACKALTDLFASATPPVTAEVLTDRDFESVGTSPWETAAPVSTTQSIIGTPADACSATHAAVFEALKVPEITLSQTVNVPGNPDLLKFWVKVPSGGDHADTFECLGKNGAAAASVLQTVYGDGGTDAFIEYTVDVTSYKNVTGAVFTFRARFGSGKPAKFYLDDVCLQPPYGINITSWSYEVNPPVIGPRQQATITVIAPGGDLTGTELRMVPQIPVYPDTVDPTTYSTTPSRYIAWPLAPVMNGTQSTATFTVTFAEPFNSSEDASALICTDGRPAFYLAVAGINGQPLMTPTSTQPLLIDTVAPELDLVTAPPSVTTANTLVPVTEGPSGWPPLSSGIPRSNGILLNRDVYWFIRQVTDPDLVLTVNAHFADRFPVDGSGNSYAVDRSGFIPANAPLLTGATATNVAVTPPDLNPMEILVNWTVPALSYGPYSFLPNAQDGAGNTALVNITGTFNYRKLDHSMRVFYMPPPPVAIFDANSTSPNQQTSTPRFGWSVTPSTGLSPLEEAPCYPVAGFQVWAVDPATGAFVSLTNNSWIWVTGAIDTNTPVAVGVTLGDILRVNRADPAQSKELYLALRGGDVAGNVQPFDASLLATNGVAQGLSLNSVNFVKWINGANQGNVAVDTDLGVLLSHATGGANGITVLRSFGAMARVPLPSFEEAKQGAYVRAIASMSARFPAAATVVLVYWKLYEDGALVAQGQAAADSTGQVQPLLLPEGLGVVTDPLPDARYFLRTGPDGIKNRMGDEGNKAGVNRQREVHYMLVAQTAATIPSTNSAGTGFDYQVITDTTPASVEFSIYVREMENKVREEQPVRIYERN